MYVGYIHNTHNTTIFLKLPSDYVVAVYPVTQNDNKHTVFPFRPAYANTMCKAQCPTLQKAILWFDVETTTPCAAYVALSHVKALSDILSNTPVQYV